MREKPQKKQETSTLRSISKNKHLEEIVNRSPAVAFVWYAVEGWPVEFVSDNIRQFGYTPQDFYNGKVSYASVIHPDDLERVSSEVKEYTQANVLEFTQEYRILTLDRQVRWVDDRTWVKRNVKGEVASYQGIVLDITERKKTEGALRESEEKFRSIVENSLAGIFKVDDSFRFVYANAELCRILDYPINELIGMNFQDGLSEESRAIVVDRYIRRQRGEDIPPRYELKIKQRNGAERDIEMIVSVVRDSTGKPSTMGQIVDITERKKADEVIRASERRLSEALLVASRRLERLETLRRIDNAIASSLDLRHTLSVFLNQLRNQLNVDAADILLFDPHSFTYDYAFGIGFHLDTLTNSSIRLDNDPVGTIVLNRQQIQIPDLRKESDFARHQAFMAERFVSYFGVPLITKGEVRGVLEIFHRTPETFDKEWTDFLESLAGQAAISIDNAALFDDLQRSNLELTLAYDATIEGWSHALDLRDEGTEGHTQRVTSLSLKLAKEMGIEDDELTHIKRGAILHDIGKMGIPDEILNKPGKLNADEMTVMKKHPEYAYEMLSKVKYLKPALDIPYSHHEKWDGTGYPRGLSRELIPLAARLFAIVDVWDALISDRPCRAAWSEDKAITYIKEQSGKHFDPDIVKTFIQILKSELSERKTPIQN